MDPRNNPLRPGQLKVKKFSNIKPILGSELMRDDVRIVRGGGGRSGIDGKAKGTRMEGVNCGVKGIDDYVLRGGFERGCIVGLSGDLGGGGGEGGGCAVSRLIAMHLVASIVLGDVQNHGKEAKVPTAKREEQSGRATQISGCKPRARAAVIDTTGSFPLPLLANIFRKRILQTHEMLGLVIDVTEVEKITKDCLERISYSRALDFVGVAEAVSEVGKGCEDVESTREEKWRGVVKEKAERMVVNDGVRERWKRKVGDGGEVEIGDSDDEEEEEEEEEQDSNDGSGGNVAVDQDLRDEDGDEEGMTEILVLDNFTNMAGGLFGETERDSAHTLISTLSQALRNLTKSHNILTILLNSTTPLTNPSSKSTPYPNQPQNSHNTSMPPKSNPTPPRSIFTSTATALRPAFEKTFGQLPDLHLFLSRLPKTRRDAKILYGDSDSDSDIYDREVEYRHIIEVLQDDYSSRATLSEPKGMGRWSREQRWAPFVVAGDGVGIQDFER